MIVVFVSNRKNFEKPAHQLQLISRRPKRKHAAHPPHRTQKPPYIIFHPVSQASHLSVGRRAAGYGRHNRKQPFISGGGDGVVRASLALLFPVYYYGRCAHASRARAFASDIWPTTTPIDKHKQHIRTRGYKSVQMFGAWMRSYKIEFIAENNEVRRA